MFVGGFSAGLTGLHKYSRAFDRAAEQVVSSGLVDLDVTEGGDEPHVAPVGPASDASGTATDQLTDGMVNMMIAQRMFSASIRVVQTQDEMLKEAVDLVK